MSAPLVTQTNMRPTLASTDSDLAKVADEIRAHLTGGETTITWASCWQIADRLLDQRLALTQ